MAEFPTYEEIAKNVAKKALDDILYQGKSIKEWVKIIMEQEPKSPCDVCRYNPPSSADGKPCTICPATEREG